MPELGRAALAVTLGLALYALLAGGYAAWRGRRRLAYSARNALIASFASTLVATAVLVAGFLRNDFSLEYVADHSSRALPTQYKISALWGGQEGSLLLWLLILTGYAALAVWVNRKRTRDLVVWTTPVLAGITVGFAWLLVAVSSPFGVVAAASDGRGLNPSLQNPYMVDAPGVALPRVRRACGAVRVRDGRPALGPHGRALDRRHPALDARLPGRASGSASCSEPTGPTRRSAGAGYYAWDPVENAALMPWLAATAYLHSVMIQEKRGMLKVWNVVLVSMAFCLSLFGTFLTRSGIVTSIHSFTKSSIGPWFLALIIIAVAFSVDHDLASPSHAPRRP